MQTEALAAYLEVTTNLTIVVRCLWEVWAHRFLISGRVAESRDAPWPAAHVSEQALLPCTESPFVRSRAGATEPASSKNMGIVTNAKV